MRVIVISPCHFNGRGRAIGDTLDVDGEDLHLLLRAGRVRPEDTKGWKLQQRPPNITWDANPSAEVARGQAADPHGGRTW